MHSEVTELATVVANVQGASIAEVEAEMNRIVSTSCTLLIHNASLATCGWCGQTSVGQQCNRCGREFVFIARYGEADGTAGLTDTEIQCLRTGPIYVGRVTGENRRLVVAELNPRWLDFVS
jgi:hypothetical protein